MRWTVILHGAIGSFALLSGLAAAFAPKRAGLHVLAGRAFAVTLLVSLLAISAPIIARANVFMAGLGMIALFSVVEGWRALLRFRGQLPGSSQPLDHLMVAVTLIMSIGLGLFGMEGLARDGNLLYLVCVLFAGLGAVLLRATVRRWSQDLSRKAWLGVHVGHMTGAFGAAITAALIVNLGEAAGALQPVLWVAPTVVLGVWSRWEINRRGLQIRT